MSIPNFINAKFVDENGNLTDTWRTILSQFMSHIQQNFSQEGIQIPQQDTLTIAKLDDITSTGRLLYDSDTHQLKVNINGSYKVVQTL